MRDTHVCPKCQNDQILFVPQLADRDDADVVRPLSLHVIHSDWRDDAELGILQAYICTKCGFTELYTAGLQAIPLTKLPGAKMLRGPKPKT